MKRQILTIPNTHPGRCCPGHDDFPCETYDNNRSKKARSKGIAVEHRFVRRVLRQQLRKILDES